MSWTSIYLGQKDFWFLPDLQADTIGTVKILCFHYDNLRTFLYSLFELDSTLLTHNHYFVNFWRKLDEVVTGVVKCERQFAVQFGFLLKWSFLFPFLFSCSGFWVWEDGGVGGGGEGVNNWTWLGGRMSTLSSQK